MGFTVLDLGDGPEPIGAGLAQRRSLPRLCDKIIRRSDVQRLKMGNVGRIHHQ